MMRSSPASGPAAQPGTQSLLGGLPCRDLWLLPLIAFATLIVLMAGSEVAARILWPEQLLNRCMTVDPVLGIHYKPNCSATMKTAEGPWYVERFNDCGYRSDAPCGVPPGGVRRLALLGTSVSEGYLVEYPDTIAARLEKDLTDLCGSSVQVQNLGSLGFFGRWMLPRMDEALRLKPQAVVLLLSPLDVEMISDDPPAAKQGPPPSASLTRQLVQGLKDSRAVAMAQHFMFRNPSVYLPLYLHYGDKADFMRPPFSRRWQARLRILDRFIAAMDARAQQAHVPFAIAFVPQEAQVGLMAEGAGQKPRGVDPTALQKAIAGSAERHGARFIDTSLALSARPMPERLYYQVDGHLSGEGQPVAAAYMARHLPQEMAPFAQCKFANPAKPEQAS